MKRPAIDEIRSTTTDTPRLAWADAIAATDPTRAELVRLQCKVARMDPWDAKRPAIEVALARLAFADAWTADLVTAGLVMPAFRPTEPYHFKPPWTFRRGFVEHLFAKAATFAARGEAISDQHPIRSLAIDALGVADANALAKARWLGRIDALSTGAGPTALAKLLASPHLRLRRLRISCPAASLAKLLEAPSLAELESLDLDVPDDRATAAAALAAHAPATLVRLAFVSAASGWGSATGQRSKEATDAPLVDMVSSSRLARLEELRLDRCDVEAANVLAELPALRHLHLHAIADEAGAALVATPLASRLESLHLRHAGDATARALAKANLPRLRALSLWQGIGDKAMSDDAVAVLLKGLVAPSLRRLELDDVTVADGAARALRALDLPALAELSIDSETMTAAAATAIVEGDVAAKLVTLELSCGRAALGVATRVLGASFPALQRLRLSAAPRDENADAAIATLSTAEGLPALRHFDFGCAVNVASFGTAGARALLERAPPELAVFYVNASGITGATKKAFGARFAVKNGGAWTSSFMPWIQRGHLEA